MDHDPGLESFSLATFSLAGRTAVVTGGNTGLVVGQPADQRTFGLTVRAQF